MGFSERVCTNKFAPVGSPLFVSYWLRAFLNRFHYLNDRETLVMKLKLKAYNLIKYSFLLTLGFRVSIGTAAITTEGNVEPADLSTWFYPNYLQDMNASIGVSSDGTLTINGGSSISSGDSYIGVASLASGKVCLSDPDSTWTNSGLMVGESGHGNLLITNGAKVVESGSYREGHSWSYIGTFNGSTGIVTITGNNSTWSSEATQSSLYIGYAGTGIINLVNGGNFTGFTDVYLAYDINSSGTVNVIGNNTSPTSLSFINIGYKGTGTLNIENGNFVNTSAILGYNGDSTGTINIDGVGSTLSGGAIVGLRGTGILNINNGGTLTGGLTIGNSEGSAGTVVVNGKDSSINLTYGYEFDIGINGTGELIITNGGTVKSNQSYFTRLGSNSGSKSTLRIDGIDSAFSTGTLDIENGFLQVTNGGVATITDNLPMVNHNCSITIDGSKSQLSINGNNNMFSFILDGVLNISNGGSVTVNQGTLVTSNGSIHFGVDGGFLNSRSLFVSPSQIHGIGTINVRGLVSDGNITFDSTHGLKQSLIWDNYDSNVTINLDFTTTSETNGTLGIGYNSFGTVKILDGQKVSSAQGFLGFNNGSIGVATVSGFDSTWINSGDLFIGFSGEGILYISNGGKVVSNNFSINNLSLLTMNVGNGSQIQTNQGSLQNNGLIRFCAGAGLIAGTVYSPITTNSASNLGSIQVLGGTWHNTLFTVSDVATGIVGEYVTFDRTSIQRVLITDSTNSDSVGASFLASDYSTPMIFSANKLSANQILQLANKTKTNALSSWIFSATNYTAGDPFYVSMNIGSGDFENDLMVWYTNDGNWTPYSAYDMNYDGIYASFTATDFGAYAITLAPEPSTFGLFCIGAIGLSVRRRYA